MAIFLSAGFIERKQTIKILYNNDTFSEIYTCLRKISNILYSRGYNICFHSQSLADYLRNYTIDNRHVPHIIKQSTIDDIRTFLSVYAIVNGNVRQQRKNEQNPEVIYYATDNRMMSDLCELIVRTGHYPMVNTIQKNNQQIYAIRECFSGEIATFQKEYVAYDAHVYDLTLASNHIMYIMRNGKCFWGSNCRCYEVPILNTEEEFWDVNNNKPSVNEVQDVPPAMRTWLNDNALRIQLAKVRGTLPYWIKDNGTFKKGQYHLNIEPTPKLLSALEKAKFKRYTIDELKSAGIIIENSEFFNSTLAGNVDFDYIKIKAVMTDIANNFDINDMKIKIIPLSPQRFKIKIESDKMEVTRLFIKDRNEKIICQHELFTLNENLQGKGISKQVLTTFYEEYKRMNVDKIELLANINVGGYTWAKYGFYAEDMFEAVSGVRGLAARNFIENWYKTNKLSHDTPFPMHLIANRPEGKNWLLGNSWHGFLDLHNTEQVSIFEKYLGLGQKNLMAIKESDLIGYVELSTKQQNMLSSII